MCTAAASVTTSRKRTSDASDVNEAPLLRRKPSDDHVDKQQRAHHVDVQFEELKSAIQKGMEKEAERMVENMKKKTEEMKEKIKKKTEEMKEKMKKKTEEMMKEWKEEMMKEYNEKLKSIETRLKKREEVNQSSAELIKSIHKARELDSINNDRRFDKYAEHIKKVEKMQQSIGEKIKGLSEEQTLIKNSLDDVVHTVRRNSDKIKNLEKNVGVLMVECEMCSERHLTDRCLKYRTLSQRTNRLRDLNKCLVCLKQDRSYAGVKHTCDGRPCTRCGKLSHHAARCRDTFTISG